MDLHHSGYVLEKEQLCALLLRTALFQGHIIWTAGRKYLIMICFLLFQMKLDGTLYVLFEKCVAFPSLWAWAKSSYKIAS